MITVDTYDTLAEANRAMQDRTRFFGGGTLLMRAVNYGDQSFQRIVRTRDAAMREIRSEGGRIVLGAGVTMRQIMTSPDVAFLAPVARLIGGPAVRNMATVGGNLFAEHPYGDLTVALLALNGRARMADGGEMDLEDLLNRRGSVRGIVSAVSIDRPTGDDFRFRKVSRSKPKGVSLMSIAAWLPRPGGRLSGVRVAYGAMGPTPVRVRAVEQALEGGNLDPSTVDVAARVATEGLNLPDDALASAWYRREVAPVHLKRLLLGEGSR
jgi:CO/xanthine dehydrogenase FAD-binding subunit